MKCTLRFALLLCLASLAAAGGHEGLEETEEVGGGLEGFGGYGDFDGDSGPAAAGGDTEALGGAGGFGNDFDLKGFAYSHVNVHKPKTDVYPIYKYVHHSHPHHQGEDAEGESFIGGHHFAESKHFLF